MSCPHNFQQTKNTLPSHIQNILNKITFHLNTSTKNLDNFNAKLNKFLAHAPSNKLQSHQPTLPINIFIQKYDDSDYMHQSHLNKIYKHDTFKLLPPSSKRTNTSNQTIANRFLSIPTPMSTTFNKQTEQFNKRKKTKLSLIGNNSLYKLKFISLFFIQTKKHRILKLKQIPLRKKTEMPPSPINLPSSPAMNSPVLAPLTKKKSPFRPISSPKLVTKKHTTSSPIQATKHTLETDSFTGEIVHHAPAQENEPSIISYAKPKQNYAESITNLPSSIDYTSDSLFVMCQLRRGKNDSINDELALFYES